MALEGQQNHDNETSAAGRGEKSPAPERISSFSLSLAGRPMLGRFAADNRRARPADAARFFARLAAWPAGWRKESGRLVSRNQFSIRRKGGKSALATPWSGPESRRRFARGPSGTACVPIDRRLGAHLDLAVVPVGRCQVATSDSPANQSRDEPRRLAFRLRTDGDQLKGPSASRPAVAPDIRIKPEIRAGRWQKQEWATSCSALFGRRLSASDGRAGGRAIRNWRTASCELQAAS